MRIAVLGGTGVAGRSVLSEAVGRGWEVVSVARQPGDDLPPEVRQEVADVVSGAGLADCLAGVDVVVDVTNTPDDRIGAAANRMRDAARAVQVAAQQGGARRVVLLSIVGIDDVPYPYYQAKVAQEEACRQGPLPVTVQRTTQFHEFAGQMARAGRRGRVVFAPAMRSRPLAVAEVATVLCDLAAAADPPSVVPELCGPDEQRVPDMVRRLLRHRGDRSPVVPLRMRGAAGRLMARGALLPQGDPRVVGPGFEQWLAGQDPDRPSR